MPENFTVTRRSNGQRQGRAIKGSGTISHAPDRRHERQEDQRDRHVILEQRRMSEEIRIEAKRGNGDGAGERSAQTPRPPGDSGPKKHAQQKHSHSGVRKNAHHIIAGCVEENLPEKQSLGSAISQHPIPDQAGRGKVKPGFVGSHDGVILPERRVFRIAAEIRVMRLKPGAHVMQRFIERRRFVAPCRRTGQCKHEQKNDAGGKGDESATRMSGILHDSG